MYVAVPLPIQPVQPVPPFPALASTTPVTTTDAKDNTTPNEGEERKSDTTTTTSNSTVPGPDTTTPNTSTTPVTSTPATTTTNPYAPIPTAAINPYLPVGAPVGLNNGLMVPSLGLNNGLVNLSSNLNGLLLSEPPLNYHLLLNQLQIPPAWNGERDLPAGPYYVLKVSCVATGYGADDRAVGHIALVDFNLKTVANVFVKPELPITSYLAPLTSLTPALLDKYGYPLEKAVEIIQTELPKNGVVVGQNICMDLQWLGLKIGTDCAGAVDLRDLWRCWSAYYNSYTHYSLPHQAKCVLGMVRMEQHSASSDALCSMKLLHYYLWCRYYNMAMFHHKVGVLSSTKIEQSFGKRNPVYEGVQMLSQKYKGVPYITAKPKGVNYERKAAVVETSTTGKEDGQGKEEAVGDEKAEQ